MVLAGAAILVATSKAVQARGDFRPDFPDVTPLHVACLWQRAEMAAFLLRQGADVNARGGPFGQTPLHLALADFVAAEGETRAHAGGREWLLKRDSAALCQLLIAHGADVLALDKRGFSPIREADLHGHGEAVLLLRQAIRSHLV